MATLTKANKGTLATPTTSEPTKVVRKRKVLKKKVAAIATEEPKILKGKKASTDAKNIKDTVTKIVESKREVKYIYPADIVGDTGKKKSFRAKARDKDKSFLKDIAKAKKAKDEKEAAKVEKAYATWRKATFLVP